MWSGHFSGTEASSTPSAARRLYWALFWAEDLMASRRSLLKVRWLHRPVAIRVVNGFHFGGSSGGARRVPPVRTAGTAVSWDLPPHSGSVGRGRSDGRWRWGSSSMDPARQMARQPLHESGRAEAKGPRERSSKLGHLFGWGRPPLT